MFDYNSGCFFLTNFGDFLLTRNGYNRLTLTTHRSTLNSDCTTISCPSCGNEFTFMLGSSCCGGEIDCDDLEQDDVEIEIL